jgi:hypothetical protein
MKLPIPKTDLLLLQPAAIALSLMLLLAVGGYQAITTFDANNMNQWRSAQSSFQQVSSSIEQIEMEEATVVRYIDQFERISRDGIYGDPNRLLLLERLNALRQQRRLYPIAVQISEPYELNIPYPPEDPLPGEPVYIKSSLMSLTAELVHEGDLLYILDELTRSSFLLQPVRCSLSPNRIGQTDFDSVTSNFQARCEVRWHNLELRVTSGE